MKYLSIILGLAATVSAIDVRLFTSFGCGGSSLVCTGLNPNTCCFVERENILSVGFYGIPTNWNINCRGYGSYIDFNTNNYCGVLRINQNNNGGNFVCLYSLMSGATYSFNGKKRAEEISSGQSDCTGSQMPDYLLLEDGQKYNVSGMEKSALAEVVDLSANWVSAADVPDIFQKFAIDE